MGYAALEARSRHLLSLFLIFSGVLTLCLSLFPVGQGNAWGWTLLGPTLQSVPSSYVLGGVAIFQILAGGLLVRSHTGVGALMAALVLIAKAGIQPESVNPWLPLILVGTLRVGEFCAALGQKVFPRKTYLFYDSTCRFCRRMANIIKSLDILDRISLIDSQNPSMFPEETTNHPPIRTMALDFHATDGNKWFVGDRAYAHAIPKLPVLWIFYPLLILPCLRQISALCYSWVRENRDRLISDRKVVSMPPRRTPEQLVSHSVRFELSFFAFLGVGTFLISILFV